MATKDGTGTTVTLGNATAFCTPDGKISATRTYTFAGITVAQRTSRPGIVGTAVAFITGDSVNTAQIMTGPTTSGGTVGITAVKRHTDPSGLTRGPTLTAIGQTALATAPAARTGPGSNESNETGYSAATGYISGTNDTASALTHLGARDYDPALGTFTAPDPILKLDEAKNFSAYLYAEGDPVNASDPSGLTPKITDDSSSWRDPRATPTTPAPYVPRAFTPEPPTYFERLLYSSRAQPAATTSSNLDLILEGSADPDGLMAYQRQYGNEAALATALRYLSFDVGWIPVIGVGSIGLDMLANNIEGKPAISEEDVPFVAMAAIPGLGPIGKLGKLGKAATTPFRSDVGHIFRSKGGHLLEDTPANRELIQSAIGKENLVMEKSLREGGTLQKYQKMLPDGTQAWAEVRGGEITNGGLNVIPK